MRQLLTIHPRDNVAVALADLPAGALVDGRPLRAAIPRGHKVARRAIAAGTDVVKYGFPIGRATAEIAPGEHVHVHNVASTLTDDASAGAAASDIPGVERSPLRPPARATFAGYRRPGGSVGVRNEVWIVNTVGCVNQASERIARAAGERVAARYGPAVGGVFAFPHPYGCSQLGDDLANTQAVLAALVRHPNAAGVLVLGLGCENNRLRSLLDRAGVPPDADRVRFFNAQDVADEVEEGVRAVEALADRAAAFAREPVSVAELIVGLKCGGSDGLSGVTANPLVGRVADRLAAAGGTCLLTEVPEMFGAEPVLLARAADAGVREATVRMVNDFRDHFRRSGQPIDENPSPGNRDGGLTTLAEKSLGCVQKAGAAPIRQVRPYAAPAAAGLGGVALVNAPGNDAVSSTALVAAGAHVILFTTGRGTPLGLPVPTLKVATNSDLARRKPHWIDFDAGVLVDAEADPEALADRLYEQVLDAASGTTLARNEVNGNREIAIWKTGVTL